MKDIYTLFNEKLAEVDASGKRKQFNERAATLTSVEAKINCANFVLGIKESRGPIKKNNGRGELLTEASDGYDLSKPADVLRKKSDKLLNEACGISEADQRRLNGLPGEVVSLTARQLREYRFLRGSRIDEANALRLAKQVV